MRTSTCGEGVGRKTVQHKGWITLATLQNIRIRKDRKAALNDSRTRAAAQKVYAEAHREVKRSTRADKTSHM